LPYPFKSTDDKSKDHIDCKFSSVKYYLKNKQIPHFIFKQEKYSQLIRDGQMSREEAMHEFNKLLKAEGEAPNELAAFLIFFGLNKRNIENKNKKSHLDYITKEDTKIKESILLQFFSFLWKIFKYIKFPLQKY